MNFFFNYDMEFNRVIPAVEVDNRANNSDILGKIGSVIRAFTNLRVQDAVPANNLSYKIESDSGNLAGYFIIVTTGKSAVLLRQVIRPAFSAFSSQISNQIISFIQNGDWQFDQP